MAILFLSVLVLVLTIYIYSKRKHSLWIQQGVKGPTPLPVIGNIWKILIFKKSVAAFIQEVYEKYPNEKIVGIYQGLKPALLLRDPELINQILITDFSFFQDRTRSPVLPGLRKLGNNLVWAREETWRVLRSKLSPLFSTKKLKDMVPLMEDCVNNYINYVEYLIENDIDHEIKSLKLKYNLQVIGSCNFGIDVDPYGVKEDEFIKMASNMFNQSIFSSVLIILNKIIPGIIKLDTTDLYSFFLNLVSKVIKERENKPIFRKDFMDLMIELKAQGKACRKSQRGISEIEMDDETIAAQAFVFYSAGFETTSGAMAFMVHELALHQNIQNKVYEEISRVAARYDGKITYEALKEMNYLEMIFYETLRKHSMAQMLAREATTDYILPGVDLHIPKGTAVLISVNGIHYDKKYYENPDKFDPDNFSREKKEQRPNCSFLAFGEGPRSCIGSRLALIQTLLAMAAFLKKFRVVPSAKTKVELEYKKTGITLESKYGIWVKILKR